MDRRKNKRCSSCGKSIPKERQDGNEGILCSKCEKGLEQTLEKHWFDKWIPKVEEVLNSKYKEKWKVIQ